MEQFRAFVAERTGDDRVERGIRTLTVDDLPEGDVTVRVAWSSLNYKDALATIPGGGVARISPLVPGIDLAGEVVRSETPEFTPGDEVIVHGYELGTDRHGGLAELARVPAGWVVPLPWGLSLREAMVLGTAGYTAALAVEALEAYGLRPGAGPVLVTGASGGFGSLSVSLLAGRGHEVVASTGSPEKDYLLRLGATEVISREETSAPSRKPLDSARWAGAVDAVGGATLAYILRTLRRGGAVAAAGNTGGAKLETTVFPFILRGVALLGCDSGYTPIERRRALWERLAADLRPAALDDESAVAEVDLDGVEAVLDGLLAGKVRGRTIVRLSG
jgi:acrylyl-CoA reductase (NADPH)